MNDAMILQMGLWAVAAGYAARYAFPMVASLCWQAALGPLATLCGARLPADPHDFFYAPARGQPWVVRWFHPRHWTMAPSLFASGAGMGSLCMASPSGASLSLMMIFMSSMIMAMFRMWQCVQSDEVFVRREAESAFFVIVGAGELLAALGAVDWAARMGAG